MQRLKAKEAWVVVEPLFLQVDYASLINLVVEWDCSIESPEIVTGFIRWLVAWLVVLLLAQM